MCIYANIVIFFCLCAEEPCTRTHMNNIRVVDCLRHQHRQWSISLGMQSKRSSALHFSTPAPAHALSRNYFSMSGDRRTEADATALDCGGGHWMSSTLLGSVLLSPSLLGREEARKANKKLNLSTNLSKYLPSASLPSPFPPASSCSQGNSSFHSIDAIEAGSSLFLFCLFLRCQQRV